MGFEQIEGMEEFHFVDFSAGWFPRKNRRDIPGAYYTSQSVPKHLVNGFFDVQHCIWFEDSLRKFLGYTAVNATSASAAGLGIGSADWLGELTQFGIFGATFYEEGSGSLTDRTGTVTLNTSAPYELRIHEQGANHFVIGGNGYGDMFKWTGAGNNAADLAGSPHKFKSFDYYGERWWGVRLTADKWNFLYGSNLTDPETNWNDSGIIFPFKGTLAGCINAGSWLAVVGEGSIGTLEGFGRTSFEKNENVFSFGTTAHRSLRRGSLYDYQYGWLEGFFMVSWQGPVFISEGKRVFHLGQAITEEWNDTTGLNKANLDTCCAAYMDDNKWFAFAIPWGAATEPNYLFIVDTARPIFFQNQVTYPIWVMPNIVGGSNYVRDLRVIKDSNEDEWLYIQDDEGRYYKFDPDELNYYPLNSKTAIEAHAQSKVYDLRAQYKIREPQLFAKVVGDWELDFYMRFDQESGDGTYGSLNLAEDADVLTTSFTLGESVLGGKTYVHGYVDGITGYGNLMQFMFKNYDADESFNIEEHVAWMKYIRKPVLRR